MIPTPDGDFPPLDANTLERLERDVRRLTDFLDEARPMIDEWVGTPGRPGIRAQVMEALDERRAAKVGGIFAKWIVGILAALGGLILSLWGIFDRIPHR